MRLGSRKPRGSISEVYGRRRLLVPFFGGNLERDVLQAAIRIVHAEEGVLVPAYLVVVPFEFGPDTPLQQDVEVAMPLLEAVERAATRAKVPVDARIERGRSPIHALRKLWEVEHFDRLLVPAPTPGRDGFSPKDLAWILTHAPIETLILRPAPNGTGDGQAF